MLEHQKRVRTKEDELDAPARVSPQKELDTAAPAWIMSGGDTCIEEPFRISKCRDNEAASASLRAKQLSAKSRGAANQPCFAAGRLALRRTSKFPGTLSSRCHWSSSANPCRGARGPALGPGAVRTLVRGIRCVWYATSRARDYLLAQHCVRLTKCFYRYIPACSSQAQSDLGGQPGPRLEPRLLILHGNHSIVHLLCVT